MAIAMLGFGMPGTPELVIIAFVALIIFGRRLPDVARSVGKSIVEFKKGLKDVKNEVDVQARIEPPAVRDVEAAAPTTSTPATPPNAGAAAPSEGRAEETTGSASPE